MKSFIAALLCASALSLELGAEAGAQQSIEAQLCEKIKNLQWKMPTPDGAPITCYTENYALTSLYGFWGQWNCKSTCDEECLAEGKSQDECTE